MFEIFIFVGEVRSNNVFLSIFFCCNEFMAYVPAV